MTTTSTHQHLTVDDIITGAIEREERLKEYYNQALEDAGPDAKELLLDFSAQHDYRIGRLNRLLTEIEELRELNGSIAD